MSVTSSDVSACVILRNRLPCLYGGWLTAMIHRTAIAVVAIYCRKADVNEGEGAAAGVLRLNK